MGLRGPKISEKSKKIIRMLKNGQSIRGIEAKGYSAVTVRYYRYKLFHPEKFIEKLKRVSFLATKWRKKKKELSTGSI